MGRIVTVAARSVLGVMAALMVATVGLASGCSSTGGPTNQNPVRWRTSTVSLDASDFWIVADGHTYLGNPNPIDVHSDPGDATYTTLELIWTENGREMRFFTYFHADGANWWSDEMRTYNGQAAGDWLYYRGTFFQSPVGHAFHGDIDLSNEPDDQLRGELHLHGVTLATALGPAGTTLAGAP